MFKTTLETISRFGIGIIIIFSPLLMGGNRDWVWLPLSFLIIIIFALFLIYLSFSKTALKFKIGSLVGLLAGIIVCLFIFKPTENLVDGLVEQGLIFTSLLALDSYELVKINYLNINNIDSLSVIYILSCVMLFILSAQYRLKIVRTATLVFTIVIGFCLQSSVSISEYFLKVDILNFDRAASTAINGTFINANHLATYQASVVSFFCGLLLGTLYVAYLTNSDKRLTVKTTIEIVHSKPAVLVLILAGILILGATGSRGAIIALIGSFFVHYFIFFWNTTAKHTKYFIFAILCLVSTLLLNSTTADKFLSVGITDNRRVGEWAISLSIFQNNPLTGYGLNSFGNVFNFFRDGSLDSNLSFSDSHSSIFRLLVETGLLGTLTVVSFLTWWYFRIIRAIKDRTNVRSNQIPILFGILLSVTTIFLHSIVDFTLSIPSIMFLTLLLMGVGIRLTKKPDSYKIRSRYLSH